MSIHSLMVRAADLPRPESKRERILRAAIDVFAQSGYFNARVSEIAKAAGVADGTIYLYFDSKEDLLNAIAQRGLRDLRLPRPLPIDIEGILAAWGRGLRLTLIDHPSLPVIFLSQAVMGPAIFRGVEALLGRLGQAGMAPPAAAHAIYAVLTYATGFVAWEIPRTRRQPQAAYAASWRMEFASLQPADFPLAGQVLDELAQVAGEEQFELGLAALAAGLAARHAGGPGGMAGPPAG